jgi:hypothetical protein
MPSRIFEGGQWWRGANGGFDVGDFGGSGGGFDGGGASGGWLPNPDGSLGSSCPECSQDMGSTGGGGGAGSGGGDCTVRRCAPAITRDSVQIPENSGSAPCSCQCFSPCPEAEQAFGGNVALSDPSDPLAGSTVVIGGPKQYMATTDSSGNYYVKVVPGSYGITFSRDGYKSHSVSGGPIPPLPFGCGTTVGAFLIKE